MIFLKTPLLLSFLFSSAVFAHAENHHTSPMSETVKAGLELHEESCVACHMGEHNQDFYSNEARKINTLPRLKGQVSGCTQVFNVDWFPDEEASVVEYLNTQFYKFNE
jgi:hypothetical protein